MTFRVSQTTLLLLLIFNLSLHAQCLLNNPSFEVGSQESELFAAWDVEGQVLADSVARHGQRAVSIVGGSAGAGEAVGLWQELECDPADTWSITGWLKTSSVWPLLDGDRALLRLEWLNATAQVLADTSLSLANASTSTCVYRQFTVLTPAAPLACSRLRLMPAVIQTLVDHESRVSFDQLEALPGVVDIEHEQWQDFPGGRVIQFSGYDWRVKGPGWYAPGPSWFSDDVSQLFVDESGALHLRVQQMGDTWTSCELVLAEPLGYGDYVFTFVGDLGQLDPHVILGLFLWQYPACWDEASMWWNPACEIDVELGRWGDAQSELAQFVVQPWDWEGNRLRFAVPADLVTQSSYAFRWLPDRVEFRAWRGDAAAENQGTRFCSWTYQGPHLPRPERARVHLNLWQLLQPPAQEQEVVISDFRFLPAQGECARLAIESEGSALSLSWQGPGWANVYHVYQSSSQNGPWQCIQSLRGTSLRLGIQQHRAFYRVSWE